MTDKSTRRLFAIQAVFDLQARRLVIVTDLEVGQAEVQNQLLAMGQTVELRRPDGTFCLATIIGIRTLFPIRSKTPSGVLSWG